MPNAPALSLVVGESHDLPPKWDGLRVEWTPWEVLWSTVRYHFPPNPCACGSTGVGARCVGIVYPPTGATVIEYVDARLPSGRVYQRKASVPEHRYIRLVADRCPDCGVDTVYDQDTDEAWELDEIDYSDAGSVASRASSE